MARRRLANFILLMDGELDKAERLLPPPAATGTGPGGLVAGGECARQRGDGEGLEEYLQNAAKSRRGTCFVA